MGTKEKRQETWLAMEELKRAGFVKNLGLASYTDPLVVEEILEVATEPIDIFMMKWTPYIQERDLLKYANDKGFLLQSWIDLASQHDLLGDPVIQKVADAHNVTARAVVIRWILDTGFLVTFSSDHLFLNSDM